MRPTWGHSHQGEEAWLRGRAEADNPYPEDSLAWMEWLKGYLSAEIAATADEDREADHREVYLDDVNRWLRQKRHELMSSLPDIAEVSRNIGIPVSEWPGKCYGISGLLLESGLLNEFQEAHGRLFLTYGQYMGPITRDGFFGGRPFARHGWLESPLGHVVDPTRFVFTKTYPAIWVGNNDDYDMSGARLRESAPVPARDSERVFKLPLNDPDSLAVFDRLMGGGNVVRTTGGIGLNQLHWIATRPLEMLGEDAPMIFRTLELAGCSGLVPSDCLRWVEDAGANADFRTSPCKSAA